jgi:hypothetical protein
MWEVLKMKLGEQEKYNEVGLFAVHKIVSEYSMWIVS